jgi:hypothetical protein
MNLLLALQRNNSGELLIISDKNTLKGITRFKETTSIQDKYFQVFDKFPEMKTLAGELNENDLLVVISARQNTVSYSRKLAVMPRVMTRYFGHTSNMILYPEQMDLVNQELGIRT